MEEKIDKNHQEKPLILLVDDTPKNLQVMATILTNARYRITIAKSAARALQILDNVTPDLILLDIMMPEMDGFELCRRLKTSETTREIPVIFLTIKAETEDIVKGFQSGGVDYITKPFNKTELLARVQNHLELKRSKEELKERSIEIEDKNRRLEEQSEKLKEIDKTGMFEYSLTHKLYQLLSNSQSLYNQQVILSIIEPLSNEQKTISLKEISQKLEKEKDLRLKDDILLREIELLVLRNLLACRIDRDRLEF